MRTRPFLKLRSVFTLRRRGRVLRDMFSFVPYRGAYYGMFREDISGIPGGAGMGFCRIKRVRGTRLQLEQVCLDRSIPEEDPRAFLFRGRPLALFWTRCNGDFYLADLLARTARRIDTSRLRTAASVNLGKNWVACVKGRRLYIVFSLQPLTVLRYDLRDHSVRLHYSKSGRLPQRFGLIRPGTSFVPHADGFIAVARATLSADIHLPVLAQLSHDLKSVSFRRLALSTPEHSHTSLTNVFDPLSMWKTQEGYMTVINRYPAFTWKSPYVQVLIGQVCL